MVFSLHISFPQVEELEAANLSLAQEIEALQREAAPLAAQRDRLTADRSRQRTAMQVRGRLASWLFLRAWA